MDHPHRNRSTTPLAHSTLQVTITDLVAEYELRHFFRNDTDVPIEAVYSFPVPLDSAFMGMEAMLAGDHRVAQVMPRHQASGRYDDAIADGDSAVLLESLAPGMLCVSLGNLKPGEEGAIVLRFAAALGTAQGIARFSLPLVHRPRYGRSLLTELEEPRHDFAVEHPLEATIRVQGLLARAPVSCATHGARFSTDGDGQSLRLNQAMLDRDLVLVFDLPPDSGAQGRLLADGEDAIGMLTFSVPDSLRSSGPLDLCLVLDGSGSMGGDAIAQSRDALRAVAGALREDDRIHVLRFGSSVVPLFRRPLRASERVREAMVSLAGTIDSDLGGTRMDEALERSIDALGTVGEVSGRSRVIILVTDGAVYPGQIEQARARALAAGIRIFVVAVGSSAGAEVLGPLAAATGAVLERAVPAEPIDEAVMRQLGRAREAAPVAVRVDWGDGHARPLPLDVCYPGDAVTAIAMLPGVDGVRAQVYLQPDARALEFDLDQVEDVPALRALAGQHAWAHAQGEARARLALHFGLVTAETSAVLVKLRVEADKAQGLPQVVPVAHMVPEGMVARKMMTRARAATTPFGSDGSGMDACALVDYDSLCAGPVLAASAERVDRGHGQLRAEPPAQPLSPGRVAQIRQALRAALDQLLLDTTPAGFSAGALWELIAPGLRDDARRYLDELSIDPDNPDDACRLLEVLAGEGVGAELSDDQEARLAVWLHEVTRAHRGAGPPSSLAAGRSG